MGRGTSSRRPGQLRHDAVDKRSAADLSEAVVMREVLEADRTDRDLGRPVRRTVARQILDMLIVLSARQAEANCWLELLARDMHRDEQEPEKE